MRLKNSILIVLFSILSVISYGQTKDIHVPFQCGFEEKEDLSQWELNAGTKTATDQWIIGNSTHSEGKRSLYIITENDSMSPRYGASPNVCVAYLRLKFPTSTKTEHYSISFDWKCQGIAETSMLYTMFVPYSQLTDPSSTCYLNKIANSGSGFISTAIMNQFKTMENGQQALLGSEKWQNVTMSDVSINKSFSNQEWALLFIWVNNNKNKDIRTLSACIDNIQIASGNIAKPFNLSAETFCEDSSLIVSWEGTSSEYRIDYRKQNVEQTWRRIEPINEEVENYTREGTKSTYKIERINEGTYEIRIRGYHNNDTSACAIVNNVLMYCPENHCINYLSLEDNPNLVCTYGLISNPLAVTGAKNLGADAMESRHTLHLDKEEKDPRTGFQLRCVPENAIGSVRLGNWDINGEAESMTYTFTVDSALQGILLINYAVVMQDPSHDENAQPRFTLEILDSHGHSIDPDCGYADFRADANRQGWHTFNNDDWDAVVTWKDWTSVGLNLTAHEGEDLQVRLTTYDCAQMGHYGYAYFTLDCINAYLQTNNCGDDATLSCAAPEGFEYEWRDETGKIIDTARTLQVDSKMHTYTCKVSYKENPDCYFELSTESAPRYPVPEYSYAWKPERCRNIVKFSNTSHVMTKYDGPEVHTKEPCADQLWTISSIVNGVLQKPFSTSLYNPSYVARSEGDTLIVDFTCYIGDENACDSTRTDTIIVPSILGMDSVLNVDICEGEWYPFSGENRTESGVYEDIHANFAGCDSTTTLYLTVHPKSQEIYLTDSICSDSFYPVGMNKYNMTGTYEVPLRNIWGCDSIVHLDLTVKQKIESDGFSNQPIPYVVCADEGILDLYFVYNTGDAEFDSIAIRFSQDALDGGFQDMVIRKDDNYAVENGALHIAIPYPETVKPNKYSLMLYTYQPCCPTQQFSLSFEVHYASSITEQNWDDVIAILTSEYTGYEFTAFQWYKDGQPISGAVLPYLYEPLVVGSSYYVELTRMENGVPIIVASCPIEATAFNQQQNFPTLARVAQRIALHASEPMFVRIYDSLGRLYLSTQLSENGGEITMPGTPGMYEMEFMYADGSRRTQHLMIIL